MTTTSSTSPEASDRVRWLSRGQRQVKRTPWIALTIVGIFLVAGIFAPWLAPADPFELGLGDRLQPPSMEHLFGTDSLGRDLLSRLIYGTRVTLIVVVVALGISAAIGVLMGVLAGFARGKTDSIISRGIDATLSIPAIFIALALAASAGPGMGSVITAVSLVLWARFARVVRSDVLALNEMEFIAQARVTGCSRTRMIAIHILPNIANSIVVLLSISIGYVIMLEASLSFLGAGIPPPAPSWGGMVSEGQDYLGIAWWISIIPGAAIALVVLAANLLGDWFREYLDPRTRDSL